MKHSVGILLYRFNDKLLEFFLVCPGGPFYKLQQNGIWSFPKGEALPNESEATTALREFEEETGFVITEPINYLGQIKLRKGKTVSAFSCQQNVDPQILESNFFELEYPKNSGTIQQFPEIETGAWFSMELAQEKIHPKLIFFIKKLANQVLEQD